MGYFLVSSDNGKEFVNKLIGDVVSTWPGHVQLISGCPRHPQSQGLVEQALERMISAKPSEDVKKDKEEDDVGKEEVDEEKEEEDEENEEEDEENEEEDEEKDE
eukprot:Em0001g2793a